MTTIFNLLENALAPYVGGADAAGAILGLSVILILFIGFLLMFGKEFFRTNGGFIVMIIAVSFVSAPGVDWFPLWVPFLLVFTLAFLHWQKYL
jgi:hypothetical protein